MDVLVSSSYIITLVLMTNLPTSFSRLSKEFKTCSKPFNCGNITNLSYPFYGLDRPQYCGHPKFELFGCNQNSQPFTMTILSQTFMVLAINSTSSTINVAREDFRTRSGCPASLVNITIDFSIFQYTPLDTNLTLFYGNCSTLCNLTTFKVFPSCPMSPSETLPICLLTRKAMLKSNISVASCPNHLFLPTHLSDNLIMDKVGDYIPQAAWNGTELKWSANNGLCEACLRSGGQCGHEPHSHKFFCFCTDECKCPFPGDPLHKVTLTKAKIVLLGDLPLYMINSPCSILQHLF
ncbi:LEAF RUST 10 DISEASE-RESISTANCE LOCUS RECEPTOR-LIKE PROTEIN KINASE-like 1.2 isoform X1 [Chenopodium quinoa]|uniref:LEAF RUST 10 DISEASE-RESISTANCE LOCUS RECEPTOR-LIKE PROTEIN KINASE-like 1.2 isoform X1 n=1 Tax=Chenopodium quinoa TaxID=63459 RepID=UPI000B7873E6|nr:LEAF RUST 10 DISEASE-RESISTANCE LOCUS RECEPTOR-LIKE PROTEIN KINASE-like 1.2 isoform X1 [Chenopodium quinoa]